MKKSVRLANIAPMISLLLASMVNPNIVRILFLRMTCAKNGRETMSGGSLNYFYSYLEEHVGDFGDKELDDLVKDLAKLFHDREWYLSADTNEGDWRESRDAFKRKWFSQSGQHERIERYLDEYRNEVLECFGLSDKRCKNCRHWTPEKEEDFPYGTCDIESNCLMHRSANCERFEKAVKCDA